jgi:hypothetical protein
VGEDQGDTEELFIGSKLGNVPTIGRLEVSNRTSPSAPSHVCNKYVEVGNVISIYLSATEREVV